MPEYLTTILQQVSARDGVPLRDIETRFHEQMETLREQVTSDEQMAAMLSSTFSANIKTTHIVGYRQRYSMPPFRPHGTGSKVTELVVRVTELEEQMAHVEAVVRELVRRTGLSKG